MAERFSWLVCRPNLAKLVAVRRNSGTFEFVFSANGAASSEAWGIAPGIVQLISLALKARLMLAEVRATY